MRRGARRRDRPVRERPMHAPLERTAMPAPRGRDAEGPGLADTGDSRAGDARGHASAEAKRPAPGQEGADASDRPGAPRRARAGVPVSGLWDVPHRCIRRPARRCPHETASTRRATACARSPRRSGAAMPGLCRPPRPARRAGARTAAAAGGAPAKEQKLTPVPEAAVSPVGEMLSGQPHHRRAGLQRLAPRAHQFCRRHGARGGARQRNAQIMM